MPAVEKIRQEDWEHILNMKTKSARRKYYSFLWRNQMIQENRLLKKEKKSGEIRERLLMKKELDNQNEHIVYGLNRNTMFLRIYDATITKFHNMRLFNAMMYGQKLIFDCSYNEYMNRQEASNCAKQLMLCFAENRMQDEPFDLQFCNMNPRTYSYGVLNRFIPTMHDVDFPMNIHEQSYLDLYDKKQLVYLTPHCKNELQSFNHDDIYIIGAMVDKTNNDPLSLAKAKKQGLRMAKLPLDKYLQWSSGSGKSLTLNQVLQIMQGMKTHGDWAKALEVVPRRKLVDYKAESPRTYEPPKFFQNRLNQRSKFEDQPKYSNQRPFRDEKRFSISKEFFKDASAEEDEFNSRRVHREQKNFDKFKFNLETWGSKTRKSK